MKFTFAILVAASAVFAAQAFNPQRKSNNRFLESVLLKEKVNPVDSPACPSASDISPCTCFQDIYYNLIFECKDATITSVGFAAIFQSDFPFKKFKKLNIDNVTPMVTIGNVFGDLVFEEVIIKDSAIQVMETE